MATPFMWLEGVGVGVTPPLVKVTIFVTLSTKLFGGLFNNPRGEGDFIKSMPCNAVKSMIIKLVVCPTYRTRGSA